MGRYLKGNKSTASPGNLCFVDTETLPNPHPTIHYAEEHTLRLGCATMGRLEKRKLTRRQTLDFTEAEQFWNWVLMNSQSDRPTWIFIHNVSFDSIILGLWEMFTDGTLSFKGPQTNYTDKTGKDRTSQGKKGFICIDSPPTIINCWHKSGIHLIIVDTLNYWVTSLRKIGEQIGVPKLEMPAWEASDDEWFRYCRVDVDVLETAVCNLIEWVKENDLGKFRYTAPSQAMAAFRHRFNSHGVVLHDIACVKQLERESYYGGRLECFFVGEIPAPDSVDVNLYPSDYYPEGNHPVGPVYELDIASMYPSVMMENLCPRALVESSFQYPEGYLAVDRLDLSYVAKVELDVKSDGFPVRQKNGIVYPIGQYTTTLAGPELMRAKRQGCISRIVSWARYELSPLFRDFVSWFWTYRREQELAGNTINAGLAKLLMNSLYGKFGQKLSDWVDVGETLEFEPWETGIIFDHESDTTQEYRMIGRLLQLKSKPQEHPSAFPAIASYVTAYARELLHDFMIIAGCGHFFYVSTDAIYVDECGYQRLVNAGCVENRTLGKLTVKHTGDSAFFRTLHNYRLGSKSTQGSVKANAIVQVDGSYDELHFESLRSHLKHAPNSRVVIRTINKVAATEYKKGYVSASGWVTPITLSSGAVNTVCPTAEG